jgi:hypothetical protein
MDPESDITISAVPEDENATVKVIKETIDGDEIESLEVPHTTTLDIHEKVEITVTASDSSSSTTYTVLYTPSDFPEIYVSVSTDPSPGYFFISNFNPGSTGMPDTSHTGKYLIILDNLGTPVWYKKVDSAVDFKVQPNGQLSYVELVESDNSILEESHPTIEMDNNYKQTAVYECGISSYREETTTDYHDSIILDNGNILLICWVGRETDLSEYGGSSTTTKMDYIIQEIDPDGNIIFEWEARDHFSIADMPTELFEILVDPFDYAHINSIDIDHNDGNIIVSSRHYSQVIKVARYDGTFNGNTYSEGDVIWRLGGTESDFTFINDERDNGHEGFAGQHTARMLPNGNIIMLDNAFLQGVLATGHARYTQYELDTETMTAELVEEFETDSYFEIEGSTVRNYSSPLAGSVQKLKDGHIVIGWGAITSYGEFPSPSITELDSDLNKVFELSIEEGEMSYRALKFNKNDDGTWYHGSLSD